MRGVPTLLSKSTNVDEAMAASPMGDYIMFFVFTLLILGFIYDRGEQNGTTEKTFGNAVIESLISTVVFGIFLEIIITRERMNALGEHRGLALVMLLIVLSAFICSGFWKKFRGEFLFPDLMRLVGVVVLMIFLAAAAFGAWS
jgi:biotin transporter BioY